MTATALFIPIWLLRFCPSDRISRLAPPRSNERLNTIVHATGPSAIKVLAFRIPAIRLPWRHRHMAVTAITETVATGRDLDKHPKGLYVLFATEMWERFSFYTMVSMFTLYLRDPNEGFAWTAAQASTLYANYMMFVYCSPLIGGWIADKKLGYRRAVMIGGFFFMAGHLLLSVR